MAMEANFMKLSLILEELKLKRNQVQKLDSEMTRLNQLLIEKDSELYAKSNQCQNLETKLNKSHNDMKQMVDTFNNRMKISEEESNRQEVTILDYSDKTRKLQTEKQLLTLKVQHFELDIKEMYEHTRAIADSLEKVNSHHDCVLGSLKESEQKQSKIVETYEMIQNYASRLEKEAEDKGKLAQQLRVKCTEMEKQFCATEARVQFLEKGLGSDTPTRKQNESLVEQLKMAKEREDKLRQDLLSERQERIILERKCNEVLARLAHSFSSEPLKSSTSSVATAATRV